MVEEVEAGDELAESGRGHALQVKEDALQDGVNHVARVVLQDGERVQDVRQGLQNWQHLEPTPMPTLAAWI